MKMNRSTALRAVASPGPKQQELPVEAPPERPFVSLARHCNVGGGPIRKLVYLIIASYSPVMAKAWVAKGYPSRETLRRECQIAKMDTLDSHLRALRADGWIDWRLRWERGHRTSSEFQIRLSPVQIAELADASKAPISGGVCAEAKTPSQGGYAQKQSPHLRGAKPPSQGSKAPISGGGEVATEGVEVKTPSVAASSSTPSSSGADTPDGRRSKSSSAPSTSESAGAAKDGPGGFQPTTKQLKLLEVCADRLGVAPAPELWSRCPDNRTLQQLITAATDARDEKPRHRHEVDSEGLLLAYRGDAGVPSKDVVQRCRCGALRVAYFDRSGGETASTAGWILAAGLASHVSDLDDVEVQFTRGYRVNPDEPCGCTVDAPCEYDGCDYCGGVKTLEALKWSRGGPFTWSDIVLLADEDNDGDADEDNKDEGDFA